MIPYAQTYAKLAERSAGYLLTATLAVFMVGRFVSTWLLRYVPATRLLCAFALINTAGMRSRSFSPRLGGRGLPGGQQLLHVHDVPHDFCVGHQGAWGADQDWRGADCDGHYRRSRNDAADGQDCRLGRHVLGVPGAGWLLVGVALYAWLGAKPEAEELAELQAG